MSTFTPPGVVAGAVGGAVFTGTGVDVTPFGAAGIAFCGVDSNTEVPSPALRVARIESDNDVTINRIADIVVAFDNSVADPRGPNAVCEPIPPNAPARSAAFPLCSNTTMIRKMHTIT